MCLNGNSAPLSIRYLNAQLAALWQNAVECASYGSKTHIDMRSADYDKHKYARALAEFHVLGKQRAKEMLKEDLFFDASFGQPRLDFVCNHEAILYFKLGNGHLNKEFHKVNVSGHKVNKKHNVKFDGLEVAFRLKFDRHGIRGVDSKIGNDSVVQFMILDFSSAKMLLIRPDHHLSLSHDIKDALSFYLHQYLNFLHGAGHHTLFDLPDFDNDKYSPHIDYSLASTAFDDEELCADISIFGTSVTTINEHLQSRWLHYTSLAGGLNGPPPADRLSTCLAEIKSTWLSYAPETHFHIKFAPPKVRALCNHEVVLYFTLDELSFYDNDDFPHPCGGYSDWENRSKWEIAFIVNVVEEKEADGCVTNIKLDLTSARFCRHLSIFLCHEEIAVRYFNLIVDFFKTEYTQLLIVYNVYSIYYEDTRIPGRRHIADSDSDSDFGGKWEVVKGETHTHTDVTVVWTETIEHITLSCFDQVLAISEESINALFKSWWLSAKSSHGHRLYGWSFEHSFNISAFRQSRVQLLSGNRAVIWFNIDSGHLLLDDDDLEYDCDGWSVAFEVDIKMVEDRELHHSDSLIGGFKKSSIYVSHGHHEDRKIRHIVFDFANAHFSFELSSLEGLFDHGPRMAYRRLESIKKHMVLYLSHLVHSGHHIIHSVPIFAQASAYGLTAVTFQVVSKTTVTVANCTRPHEAPVILVLGVCGTNTLPPVAVTWGCGWVIPSRKYYISYGSLCLSRSMFLEGRLLRILEKINAQTTIVPRFPTESEEEYKVYLTTWEQHRYRQKKHCKWTPAATSKPGWLEFAWNHRDEWSYEHEMSGEHNEIDEYSVLCHTRNQLLIPTSYRPGCLEITMRGESKLRLKGKSEHNKWSKLTTAEWDATIRVYTDAHGLRVEMSDSVKPVFHKNEHVGEFSFEDAYDLHVRHLPNVIDFHEILHDLQEGLQGVWEYSYPSGTCYALASPVFNRHGDLIVQLRTQDPHAKPLPPPQAPALGGIICALPPRSPILLTPAVSFADKPVPFEAKPKVAPPPLVQPKINVTKPKVVPVPEKPKIQKKESILGHLRHLASDLRHGGHHEEKEGSHSSSSGPDSPPLATPALPHTAPPPAHKPMAPVVNKDDTDDYMLGNDAGFGGFA